MVGGGDTHREALLQEGLDRVDHAVRQAIEVADIVRDVEDEDRPLRIAVVEQDREAPRPVDATDDRPGVVRIVVQFGEQHVLRRHLGIVAQRHAVAGAVTAIIVVELDLVPGRIDLDDILETLVLGGFDKARGDEDRLAVLQLLLDLVDDVRVLGGGGRQQDDRRVLGKVRGHLDRDTHIAEIVLQEVLARRLEGLVARNADRVAELTQYTVDLFQSRACRQAPARAGIVGATILA